MEAHSRPSMALFDVYLRLRPNSATNCERFLDIEHTEPRSEAPTHITVKPPASDYRKRAIEKFAFTRVFEEYAGQREVFESTGTVQLIEGVLGGNGREGRDGLVATLGVTGSGKSHTILGSKSQRGITQLTLDALFRQTSSQLVGVEPDLSESTTAFESLETADVTEAQLEVAATFLDRLYADNCGPSRGTTPARGATPARAATPGLEGSLFFPFGSKRHAPRMSLLPTYPPIDDISILVDPSAEYAILISMYEVHNDRIFDLLGPSVATKMQGQQKRMPKLFKSTERSQDRKVVAGLRKVICSDLEEALLVLETGLQERRVAGTGSNAASSRSHGFFCIEVKKRHRAFVCGPWTSSTLTIVDLAGSERARIAKTAGATLAEAGKINESLMYLGQCMQMQLDHATANPGSTPSLVPFRQCKLTELLFSNSFTSQQNGSSKAAQKAIMIVTADPLGDFNATSQILRYSALAREVTVPRIASTSSTILSGALTRANSRPDTPSAIADELDNALAEIARLRGELEIAQVELDEERNRRQQAEASWQVAESRIDEVEIEIREEMWTEMEAKLLQEQRRWRAARDAELDAQDNHIDRKLEILTRGISIYEDEDKENTSGDSRKSPRQERESDNIIFIRSEDEEDRLADLKADNARLKERVALLEREKEVTRSPSKKMRILKTRRWEGSGLGVEDV